MSSAYILLLLVLLSSFPIILVDMVSAQPIIVQLDNSTNVEEQVLLDNSTSDEGREVYPFDIVDGTHALLLVIAFIAIAIRARSPKTKLRVGTALFLVLGSMVLWTSQSYFLSNAQTAAEYNADNYQRGLAIFLVIIAFIPLAYRTKKPIPWKEKKGIRRYFSAQVRQDVLNSQKYKCANCDMSISQPLVHFDHIDGNNSNNDISNCQALCPNCHSLKTDDDRRRNQ